MAARYRYNPPPNWPPPPPGWSPPYGWNPPAEWGPPPANWQYWVRAGFWQPKNVVPLAFFAVILVIVLVLTLPWESGLDTSSDSYRLGYDSGEGLGKTFGLLSGEQLTEESKGMQCRTFMDIEANQGFELDGRAIPESDVDEEEYVTGCKAGFDDGAADPLSD